MKLYCSLVVFLVNFLSVAFATDLIEIYQQALMHDPEYQMALSNRLAIQERLPQSRAGLLPQLSGKVSVYRYLAQQPTDMTPSLHSLPYNGHIYQVDFKQPLLAIATWQKVNQAKFSQAG